jgi:RNA polymerase sigma-70 factor (ECF subfamily)
MLLKGLAAPSETQVLVEAIRDGRGVENSFEQLYRLYKRGVLDFFTRRGFSLTESEDLSQETFFRAFKDIDKLRESRHFASWLFRIAANTYRNELRRWTARKRGSLEVPLDLTDHPDLNLVASDASDHKVLFEERARVLRAAIDDLPPQMRRCVLLWMGSGLKHGEIALLMRISVGTVKSHLFQARQQLRARLAHYFEDQH